MPAENNLLRVPRRYELLRHETTSARGLPSSKRLQSSCVLSRGLTFSAKQAGGDHTPVFPIQTGAVQSPAQSHDRPKIFQKKEKIIVLALQRDRQYTGTAYI